MTDYTGRVSVGGPADTRELAALSVTKLAVGPMNNNTYLLRCRETGAGLLIDAAAEPERLRDLVRLGGDPVQTVLTTHRHADHTKALRAVVEDTGARTLAGREDADHLPVPTDGALADGDTVTVGSVPLEIIALRGHTPGSVAVLYRDPGGVGHLFTGDSLFPGGPGRTDGTRAFDSLMTDLESRVFARLADETWVYPGHGDDTTLGAERPHLGQWRARGW